MIRILFSISLLLSPLAAQAPPTWTVEARPLVISGGGDDNVDAELLNVRGAIRLPSGTIVVANWKPLGLKVYDADGRYQRTLGRPGGGPGEFQYNLDARVWGGDSVLAVSGSGMRHALFRLDGVLVRDWTIDAGDRRPAMVVHRRAMLRVPTGGLTRCARQALDALPLLPDGGIREVISAGPGRFWVRTIDERDWQVIGADGRTLARLTLPERFDPYQVGDTVVLGRTIDADDVETVTLHRVTGARAPAAVPACDAVPDQFISPVTEQIRLLRDDVRNAIVAGEMFYANEGRYPQTLSDLARAHKKRPETDIRILSSGSRGWALAISDRSSGASCMMALGTTVLAGWPDGEMRCGG